MKNYVKPMSALVAMSMEENIATSGVTFDGSIWKVLGGNLMNTQITLAWFKDLKLDGITSNVDKATALVAQTPELAGCLA